MNDQRGIIIGIGIAIAILIIFVIVKGIKSIGNSFKRNYSEQEARQVAINLRASQVPNAPGEGLKDKKGCSWIIWLIIAAFLAYLLLFTELPKELFK